MQTPIQQAIEQIKKSAKYTSLHYQSACDDNIAILTALLPTEREVIEEAYDAGSYSSMGGGSGSSDYYFTKKFGSND